ncbi:MAG: serine--tRNA ligase, partial [Anaerolineae bacterium]|nr:serine--tRNA ligase [Anaerolineae bacterium]
MIDIKLVQECPDAVREALIKRNSVAPVDEILSLDEKRRTLLSETETLRARRNVVSRQISRMKDDGERRALIDEMREVGTRIKALNVELHAVQSDLKTALLQVPNMPHPDTPVGSDENENVVVRSEGTPREFDFEPLAHWDLGPALGIIDFERGVRLSGTRFYVLKGLGARLQRALIAWMLEL